MGGGHYELKEVKAMSLVDAIEAYHKGEVNALEVEAAMVAADIPDELIHLFIDMHRQLIERTNVCDCCGNPLEEPGALYFEPPQGIPSRSVKHHICVNCNPKVLAFMKNTYYNERPLTNPD